MNCEGCLYEMEECYRWQQVKGAVAGLRWGKYQEHHCCLFVINEKTGEFIVE